MLRTAVRAAGWYGPVLAVACLAAGAAELLLPAALGRAVDAILGRHGGTRWLVVVGALVAVAAVSDVVDELASGVGTARATARLRAGLLRHVLALPPATAARYPVGDLVARLVGQAGDAGSAATTLVYGVVAALPPVGSLVALFLIDPWLGVGFLGGLALLGVLMRGFVTDTSAALAGYQRVQGRIAGRFVEALAGARTIAAAGTAGAEVARILRPLPALRAHGLRTWAALATAAGRGAVLAPLVQLVVLGTGGLLVATGRLSPGGLLAAVQYAALGAGLGAVVSALNRATRTRAGARRLAEVLAAPQTAYGTRELAAGPGTLELRGVRVESLLDDITLAVPGGRTVAVVGRSGSGKSVLAAVAGRLRDPDGGEVTLDGVPLRALTHDALAGAVGYGFERPVLVGTTVRDAIGLAREGFPVEDAARTAAVDDYVRRLPEGYATPLPEAPMSGGEAQRLGLARALHATRLLVLDDAASSVDSVTEARLRETMARDLPGRTRLVVTHRAATAARADLVAWLDAGRLRGLAPHCLLWTDPEYRAVFG